MNSKSIGIVCPGYGKYIHIQKDEGKPLSQKCYKLAPDVNLRRIIRWILSFNTVFL